MWIFDCVAGASASDLHVVQRSTILKHHQDHTEYVVLHPVFPHKVYCEHVPVSLIDFETWFLMTV